MRILHVEDEYIHHESIKIMLEKLYGAILDIHWVSTYDDAVEIIQVEDFDLIILDYILNDYDATDVLKAVDAPNLNMPFIVISGFDDHKFDVAALRMGADDYLVKGSFSTNDLRRTIDYATYRKGKMYSLNKMAFYDGLTKLPNRYYLSEHTEKSIYMSTRVGRFVGVYYIDVDNFKDINDTYGHSGGDEVLRVIGERLENLIRKTDTAVRLGGDEFLIVSPGITRIEYVKELGNKIHKKLCEPVPFDNQIIPVTSSIGRAMIPGDADDLKDAIEAADKAMYQSKLAQTS